MADKKHPFGPSPQPTDAGIMPPRVTRQPASADSEPDKQPAKKTPPKK